VSVDTLANGLPIGAVAAADDWVQICRRTIPHFVLDSLVPASPHLFQFHEAWPGLASRARGTHGAIGERGLYMYSPDSCRFVNFNMYAEVTRDKDGRLIAGDDPESAPVLGDLVADTLWMIGICRACCSFDGAYWVDASRFVLTGMTVVDCETSRPFVNLYDLRLRRVRRWLGTPVTSADWSRYNAARDSALVAHFAMRAR
jgi:hypothetical protein